MSTEEALSIPSSPELNAAVTALAESIQGEVVVPADTAYDEARRVITASFDRRPAVIVRPASADDVMTAVKFARQLELEIAVRSGGHSPAGYGTCDGGLVIDFSLMKGISFDDETGTVRIDAGCTWAEVSAALHPRGLAISSGDFGSVGVGGLTTGGGIGWMVRKVGLTVDHLLGADVVLADGTLVHASEDENQDLFWAIRGGGGNFGIVVSFHFRPHAGGMITGGAIVYDAADIARVVRGVADYVPTAPDGLTVMVDIMHAPPMPFLPPERYGTLIAVVGVCYAGDPEQAQEAIAPLRSLGTPVADVVGPMPYPAMFALTEDALSPELYIDIRSCFLEGADDSFVDVVSTWSSKLSSPRSIVQVRALGGEMARRPADSAAFSHRDKPYLLLIASIWEKETESEMHRRYAADFWRAVAPHASGVYVGFLADEGEEGTRSAYSESAYRRLAQIKATYDPDNLFHLNHNIRPAASA